MFVQAFTKQKQINKNKINVACTEEHTTKPSVWDPSLLLPTFMHIYLHKDIDVTLFPFGLAYYKLSKLDGGKNREPNSVRRREYNTMNVVGTDLKSPT